MSYVITITKRSTVTKREQGPWTVVDTRPWTAEEFSEATGSLYGKAGFSEMASLKEVRGYAPERNVEAVQETEILKQTVEELDIAAVIKAINSL